MSNDTLSILLVDDRPPRIWSLSNFLESAGYAVVQAGSGSQALAALDRATPHFLVAQWELTDMSGVELCRRIRGRRDDVYIHALLATAETNANALTEGLQAGVDDFLNSPIVHGELLSRLRAGARVWEYERRVRATSASDALTGLSTVYSWLQNCKSRLEREDAPRGRSSCVVVDLDFFAGINALHGRPAGDAVLKGVAERLGQLAEDSATVARVYADRFCIFRIGASEQEAHAWAEEVRRALHDVRLTMAGKQIHFTASFGIAEHHASESLKSSLDLASQALKIAKQTGRNRAVSASNTSEIIARGKEDGGTTDPLKYAVARDIMTSSVVCFHEREPLCVAAELFNQCKQTVLPVVDADGKLLGTVSQSEIDARLASDMYCSRPIREVMATDAPQYEEETTVQALYEFFREGAARRVEIVAHGRPTGFVTRGSLASLGEAITLESFRPKADQGEGRDSMLVPDLGWIEDAG